MQASSQDLSAILGNLLQGPLTATAQPGQAQPIGGQDDFAGSDFLASLEASLQALADGQSSPNMPSDPAQLLAALEQLLAGVQQAPGGNGLPLEAQVAATRTQELTPQLQAIMVQLQQAAAERRESLGLPSIQSASPVTGQPEASPHAFEHLNMVVLPVTANSEAQTQVEQRRLLERLRSLLDVRQAANDLPASALRQTSSQSPTQSSFNSGDSSGWLGNASADLALTPATQGDDFALQMSRMAELKELTLSLKEGAAVESKGGMPDVTTLAGSGSPRHVTLTQVSDARPTQSFIQSPLHHPQWQSEFSDRVTWMARSGGNQTAEIRLNPANMGPIKVQVMMNDDQATITFTAQNGAVRDAIEASLPRLREMFMGSGLQLAQANVSDQPLHEQRQQQGFGSGNGRSKERYEQVESVADLVSPISLSMSNSMAIPVGRLDLYA